MAILWWMTGGWSRVGGGVAGVLLLLVVRLVFDNFANRSKAK